jgi:CheY-like chemotaxis protein/putative methionine-R-sulfoxide reductase with GAF domain
MLQDAKLCDSPLDREIILIIEDNPLVREFILEALEGVGDYQMLMAANGAEGLERALTVRPDAIFLDLSLPHIDGLEVLRHLQTQKVDIPVIVVTADDASETIVETFRLGAKDFVSKPFHVREVREALEKALTEARLRQEKERLADSLLRANRRLQRQLDQWMALNDIAQAISSTLDEREIFRRVMANVQRILQVEAGSLLLRDPHTGDLHFVVTLGGSADCCSHLRLPAGEGVAGWVAEHGRSLLVPDVSRDERFTPRIDQLTGFRSRSILCVPLWVKEQVIGVLEVVNKRSGPQRPAFTPADQELLENLASWVAIAVENARLTHSMRRVAATRALKQGVTTLAHHINNQLLALNLELEDLRGSSREASVPATFVASVHGYIRQITAVLRALDHLDEIQTVPYVGSTNMLNIETALAEELRRLQSYSDDQNARSS